LPNEAAWKSRHWTIRRKAMTLECDLAIVGGGIAGPALAAALADDGHRIVLIERSAEPLDTARGDHLQPVTCESLERWGVLDMMLAHGAEKRLGARWQTPDGQVVLDARVDNLPIAHPYFLYLNHEKISEVLLARAAQNPGFTVLRPGTARVIRDATAPGGHGLSVEHADGRISISARCIAIADGRASRNRKALEIEARSHNYANPLLVMFTPRTFDDPRNDVHVFLTSLGIISVVPRTGGQWKIGFPLAPAALAGWSKLTSAQLGRRLAELVPALEGVEPHVAGVYPVAMVNASRWTDGNCVLLGDACHALHPGRSQGMNVALRGVATLAQDLRDGGFPASSKVIPALLAEFEAEHRPPIDARLEDNHARGLEMDRMDADSVERTREALTAVASVPEKIHRYRMNAAGY
jgi:2-polyprenyl-6-methoxyphenol hydroxylase-like FAD-dependent oxidoreductase